MSTTTRRFVNQLGDNESVDQIFLASGKQLRPNRSGNLYLQVALSDRTGTLDARMWNATEEDYQKFENGDYVHIHGSTQIFQGAIQLIANRVRRADKSEVDETEFTRISSSEIDRLLSRLAGMLRGIEDPHLRNLGECFLLDETLMQRVARAPAGIKLHHAYHSGLLEHVVNMMELVLAVAPRYPELDADQLLFGTFLHDLGKVEELSYDRDLSYTDAGQLLGHIVLAITMLDTKIREAEQLGGETFPEELAARIKHMILSHHGSYEHGSPKLPMTPEALALSCLDHLDSKLHQFQELIETDPNKDSAWTPYHANLARKLFKGN